MKRKNPFICFFVAVIFFLLSPQKGTQVVAGLALCMSVELLPPVFAHNTNPYPN